MDGELIRSLRAEARKEAEEIEALEWLRSERKRTLMGRLVDAAAAGRTARADAAGHRFAGRLSVADDHIALVDGVAVHRVRTTALDRVVVADAAGDRGDTDPGVLGGGTATLVAALTEIEMTGDPVELHLRDGSAVYGRVRVRAQDHVVLDVEGSEVLVALTAIVAMSTRRTDR